MALPDIEVMSDEDKAPPAPLKPGKGDDTVPKAKPQPKALTPKAKTKAQAKPKAKAKESGGSCAVVAAEPETSGGGPPMKRPAAAVLKRPAKMPNTTRCYKYTYYAENKVGFKINGKQVGVVPFLRFCCGVCVCVFLLCVPRCVLASKKRIVLAACLWLSSRTMHLSQRKTT